MGDVPVKVADVNLVGQGTPYCELSDGRSWYRVFTLVVLRDCLGTLSHPLPVILVPRSELSFATAHR